MLPMSQPPAEQTTAKRSRRAWRRLCFLAAAAILLVATPLSLSQDPAPDPLRPPEVFSLAWWWLPIEVHASDRLPWVDADLLDVAAVADGAGAHVVAVGRKGTIIASDDGGLTWRRELARVRAAAGGDGADPQPGPGYGSPPGGADDPKSRPAPPRGNDLDPKKAPSDGKQPENKPPKAAGLLDWLVPSAHAIEAPESEAARQQQIEPGDLRPASEDLVAVV